MISTTKVIHSLDKERVHPRRAKPSTTSAKVDIGLLGTNWFTTGAQSRLSWFRDDLFCCGVPNWPYRSDHHIDSLHRSVERNFASVVKYHM